MLDFRNVIQNGIRHMNPFTDSGLRDGRSEISILGKNSIFELNHEDMEELESGLDVSGFDFSMFSGTPGEDCFRSNMRIIARRFLPPVNASDTNYFDKMHMESACLFFPEDVAKDARAVWREEGSLRKTASAGIEGSV